MKNLNSIVSIVKNLFVFVLIIFVPLFFLPLTQEYYTTSKIYLLAFGGLFLIILSTAELFIGKKISWEKRIFDNAFFLFVATVGISILLISPNKIQAIFNSNFGLLPIVSLFVFYFYLSRNNEIIKKINLTNVIQASGIILAVVTLLLEAIRKINLPQSLALLKNPVFTPVGMQIDLAILLGFFAVFSLNRLLIDKASNKNIISQALALFVNTIALGLTIFLMLKPANAIILPPLRLSWFAAVEVLKNPLNALFGIGVDNFSSIFTKVKDVQYNQSTLWQIQSFTASRSTILHILTETGLFGLVAFGLLIVSLFKIVDLQNKSFFLTAVYLLLVMILFPPSFITLFLLTIFLAFIANLSSGIHHPASNFDISQMIPLYLGIPTVVLIIVGAAVFFLFKNYQAEVFHKKALDSYGNNNLKELYDNEREAILINPSIEKYRINFSQTNLLIANNIMTLAVNAARQKGQNTQLEISSQNQQTISQAIQVAISEAKAAITLNPQKAGNWENLALIYRNIMNYVQGQADAWTVSAYQQAILSDPQNPTYRLNLGSVYYSLGIYDEAVKIFEQTATLKPDWPNAYYNLAWSFFQKNEYQKAAQNMQNTIYLLNPKKDKADYDKAMAEFEEFKKKIPSSEITPTPTPQEKSQQQLTLPTPQEKIEAPIKLPKEASPEAN